MNPEPIIVGDTVVTVDSVGMSLSIEHGGEVSRIPAQFCPYCGGEFPGGERDACYLCPECVNAHYGNASGLAIFHCDVYNDGRGTYVQHTRCKRFRRSR